MNRAGLIRYAGKKSCWCARNAAPGAGSGNESVISAFCIRGLFLVSLFLDGCAWPPKAAKERPRGRWRTDAGRRAYEAPCANK